MASGTTQTKVRFAPSPTGPLHIGSFRIAALNWLYARQRQGMFLLRIEDTDQARSKAAYTAAILEALEWTGLHFEGEPVYQSQRFPFYTERVGALLESGHAYRCACLPAAIEAARKRASEESRGFRCEGPCRSSSQPKDVPHVVRFRVPDEGFVSFVDHLQDLQRISARGIEDFVLLRENGIPTFHLANVADDIAMGITDVIRGGDHLSNTPKHLLLFRAFNAEPPRYAHVPLILGPDHQKLSKRHGAKALLEFRDEGFMPESMFYYMASLGQPSTWPYAPPSDLAHHFSLDGLKTTPAVFDIDKLREVNRAYICPESPLGETRIRRAFREELGRQGVRPPNQNEARRLEPVLRGEASSLAEMVQLSRFFLAPFYGLDSAIARGLLNADAILFLEDFRRILGKVKRLDQDRFQRLMEESATRPGVPQLSYSRRAEVLRFSLTGEGVGIPLGQIARLLGVQEVDRRIQNAIAAARLPIAYDTATVKRILTEQHLAILSEIVDILAPSFVPTLVRRLLTPKERMIVLGWGAILMLNQEVRGLRRWRTLADNFYRAQTPTLGTLPEGANPREILFRPLSLALTGSISGFRLAEIVDSLGPTECLRRMDQVTPHLEDTSALIEVLRQFPRLVPQRSEAIGKVLDNYYRRRSEAGAFRSLGAIPRIGESEALTRRRLFEREDLERLLLLALVGKVVPLSLQSVLFHLGIEESADSLRKARPLWAMMIGQQKPST